MFRYHADESFHDYYRFSDEALTHLFGHFSEIKLLTAGGYTNAMLRFVAGFTASQRHLLRLAKSLRPFLAQLARMPGTWHSPRVTRLRRSPTPFNFLARKYQSRS